MGGEGERGTELFTTSCEGQGRAHHSVASFPSLFSASHTAWVCVENRVTIIIIATAVICLSGLIQEGDWMDFIKFII